MDRTKALTDSIFIYSLGHTSTCALEAFDVLYLVDSPPTVLLSNDNHESFTPHISQTENIPNRETQGKVSLPACIDLSFFLKPYSQTKLFQILIFFWTEKRCF